MRARALAVATAVAPPVLAWFGTAADASLWRAPWLPPLFAVIAGAALAVVIRRRLPLIILGTVLAAAAAIASAAAQPAWSLTQKTQWPTIDLTDTPFPDPAPPHVAVTGYFQTQWRLDEYAVPDGQRPNQNEPAKAVLVPFVGTTENVVVLTGPPLVARVSPDQPLPTDTKVTLRGTVTTLPPDLLTTLVQLSAPPEAPPTAYLLDTLNQPTPTQALTQLTLTILLTLLATTLLLLATKPQSPP